MKHNVTETVVFVFIAIAIFLFFSVSHPVLPFHSDDWQFFWMSRDALPIWEAWNPGRIFPEILSPLCGEIAMDIIYPLTGNVTTSLGIMTSIVISLSILIYIYMFYRFVSVRTTRGVALLLSLLFLVLHFAIFKNRSWVAQNDYLFYGKDLCFFYFYTIPNCLVSAFVLYMISVDKPLSQLSSSRLAIILPVAYLSVFSNLYVSILLAAYIASILVGVFVHLIYQPIKNWNSVFQSYWIELLILVLWFVSLVYEAHGGRSQNFEDIEASFFVRLSESFSIFVRTLWYSNKWIFAVGGICFGMLLKDCIRKKQYMDNPIVRLTIRLSFSLLLSLLFCLLLGAKVEPERLGRGCSIFSIFFFVFMIMAISVVHVVRTYRWTKSLLPLFFLLLFCHVNMSGRSFRDAHNIPAVEIRAYNDYMHERIVQASMNRQDTVYLDNPVFGNYSPTTFVTYKGDHVVNFYYKYGLISHPVTIVFEHKKDMLYKY